MKLKTTLFLATALILASGVAQARNYHYGCVDLRTGDQYTGVMHCFTISAPNRDQATRILRSDSRYYRSGRGICSFYGSGGDPYNRYAPYPNYKTTKPIQGCSYSK